MPPKVLVVDDEKALAQALAIRLRAAGLDAVTAEDGRSGIERALSVRPDAIVLDIRLPDMDGFEVHERLKRMDELRGVPVLFLSANMQDSARHAALAAGAFAYLTKPYDPREVVAKIRCAIGRRGNEGDDDHGT